MSRFGVCVVLIVLTALTGCAKGPRANWQEAVTRTELAEVALDYRWQNVIPLDKDENVKRIWHLDENVYCLTDENRVLVFDAVTGERRWSQALGHRDERVFAPTHADRVPLPPSLGAHTAVIKARAEVTNYDLVIFNTVTYALVYQRDNGKLLHRIEFSRANFAANTGSACDGARIFVGAITGKFHALELVSGLNVWKGNTKAILSATPVYMGGNLYVASQDGTIYSVRIGSESGQKLWPIPPRPQAGGAFTSDITVNDQGVFAGNADYSVYALDPVTGQTIWRYRCGGAIRQPVQVGLTNVYALATGDQFYAIDLATGRREKWTVPNGVMVLSEIGNTAYVLNSDNELMAIDAATGTVRTVVPLTGLNVYVANTTTPAIYATSSDGLLCCLQPKGKLTGGTLGLPAR